jgi:hypothetical protein
MPGLVDDSVQVDGASSSMPTGSATPPSRTGRPRSLPTPAGLLACCLPKGAENHTQPALIGEALAVRPPPDSGRGVAPSLQGLAGTWAHDSQYAIKISAIANQILTQAS